MSFGNCRNYCVTDEAWRDEAPDTIKAVSKLKSPRVIKTHFCYEMLPTEVREKKCKVRRTIIQTAKANPKKNLVLFQVVYVTRNPRDALCSFFNHFKVIISPTSSRYEY